MDLIEYRQAALSIALDATHPRHLLPEVPLNATSVLDVGCHAGHILEALKLPAHCRQVGCDINREALVLARLHLPHVSFHVARAEALPFEPASFDMLFARGVVTALDIPKALREFNRVLKPGGKLWISLYRWQDCRLILEGNWEKNPIKTIPLGIYLLANSALFHHTGRLLRYPFNRSRILSFQTQSRFQRILQAKGFDEIQFSHGAYFVVQAVKPRLPVLSLQAA